MIPCRRLSLCYTPGVRGFLRELDIWLFGLFCFGGIIFVLWMLSPLLFGW